ncbi:MAG TPA: glycosyltransferase family 4 protein [Saprospiraceae bacterium]|nr:glycosyltransferase family 4 protein [Saprospiraceae bacterium]
MKKNIYFLVSHPIQYYVPLYQLMAKEEDVNVKVFYCSDETIKGAIDKEFGVKVKWDIPLLSNYNYEFLNNHAIKPSIHSGFWGLVNPGIISALFKAEKGLVIINGWNNFSYILGFVAAKMFGHTTAIRCEAPFYKESNRKKSLVNKIRFILLKYILFGWLTDYYLYVGKQNYQFYKYFGVKENKLIFTPYAVDNDRFRNEFLQTAADSNFHSNNGHQKQFTVLFTGKLYKIKRPFDLLDSFNRIQVPGKRLIIVGDGILKKDMDAYIKKENISDVEITGFVNQTEIPKYYLKADVLVLCSESETWGLSINEAMNFDLPVVAYDSVGCAADLIRNGINGFVVENKNVGLLSEAIENIYRQNWPDNQMGKASGVIISDYSNKKIIEGIRKIDV